MRVPRTPFALMIVGAFLLVACGGDQPGGSTTSAPTAPKSDAAAPAARPRPPAPPPSPARSPSTAPSPPAEKVKLDRRPKCAAMHKDGLEKQADQGEGRRPRRRARVREDAAPRGTYPAPTEPALLDQQGCNYSPARHRRAGGPADQDPQQRRHAAQHPPPPDGQRRVQHRPAAQGHGVATQELRQGGGHDPGGLRRAPLDALLHLGPRPPVLRGHARTTARSRSRACPPASTRSRPSTRS